MFGAPHGPLIYMMHWYSWHYANCSCWCCCWNAAATGKNTARAAVTGVEFATARATPTARRGPRGPPRAAARARRPNKRISNGGQEWQTPHSAPELTTGAAHDGSGVHPSRPRREDQKCTRHPKQLRRIEWRNSLFWVEGVGGRVWALVRSMVCVSVFVQACTSFCVWL